MSDTKHDQISEGGTYLECVNGARFTDYSHFSRRSPFLSVATSLTLSHHNLATDYTFSRLFPFVQTQSRGAASHAHPLYKKPPTNKSLSPTVGWQWH